MEVISTSQTKARKQHRCDYCFGLIEAGEIYKRTNISTDGYLYVWKSHINCEALAHKLNMFDEIESEGLTPDIFQESIEDRYWKLNSKEDSSAHIPFSDKLAFVCKAYICTHDKETITDGSGYEVCPGCGKYGEDC